MEVVAVERKPEGARAVHFDGTASSAKSVHQMLYGPNDGCPIYLEVRIYVRDATEEEPESFDKRTHLVLMGINSDQTRADGKLLVEEDSWIVRHNGKTEILYPAEFARKWGVVDGAS